MAVNHRQEEKKRRTLNLIVVFILLASIILSYYPVKNYDFVNYDDPRYVTTFENEELTLKFIASLLTSFDASNWHPLTWISHIIDTRLFGMNAGAHHLVNVFFHIINTLVLYHIFYKTTGETWKSCFVAGLFAIHPLHVESVAWVAERKDVLSTMFWMLTITTYIRYAGKPRLSTYIPVFLFFSLGLMAKPMLVTLPFVLILLDFWPLCRFANTQQSGVENVPIISRLFPLIIDKIPLLALSAVASLLTVLAQKSGGAINSLDVFSLKIRLANAVISYAAYIAKMFVPINLSVFYPYTPSIPVWKILIAGTALICITFFTVRRFKIQPYLFVGWFWYLGTLVPVIGLVQVGMQSMADRYTYIPLIGLFVMMAWGFPALLADWKHKEIVILSTALLIYSTFLVFTWFQVRHWADNFSLYQHAIYSTDKNHVAHNNLGAAFYKTGNLYKAIWHFLTALEIKPDDHETLANFRAAARTNRNIDQSIESVQRLLSAYPKNSGLCYTVGVLYGQKGAYRQAIEYYQRALVYYPKFAQAQFDLGYTYVLLGEYDNALSSYKRAIEIQPDLIWAYYHTAAILSLENQVEESLIWLERAIKKGYKDWEFLKNDKKMNNIKHTSSYKRIMTNKGI